MKRFKKILSIILMTVLIQSFIGVNFVSLASSTYNQTMATANSSNNNGIDEFPESYQTLLRKLVSSTGRKNWKFIAFNTDIEWKELIENETDCLHNTIYKSPTSPYPDSWYDECGNRGDVNFYCASEEIISYYLDPRNFLTEITIFQFLDLSNNQKASLAQIQSAVKGTYLEGNVDGDTYAQMIYDAAEASGESAFSIIVRIFQELGRGTSLPHNISGKDSKYPGVYNFFNYGATDGDGSLERALAYAQNAGWTSARKALIEGAKLISNNYTKAGQVNKYLYKFDVVGTTKSQLYRHQYMTNVEDPNSQAYNLYSMYSSNNWLKNDLVFVIPVYKNMPSYVKLPSKQTGDLYYVSSNYTPVSWRNAPNGASIGTLKKDTVVTMLEANVNGFGKIMVDGKIGYMSMQYLTKLGTTQDGQKPSGGGTTTKPGEEHLGGEKDSQALISYKAQIQDIGWSSWASDGETMGTIDKSKRLETIQIELKEELKQSGLKYRVHVQDIGWMSWSANGETAGTVGKSKRIEAVQIVLENSELYDIEYRVYVQNIGWMNWSKNGEIAGTVGAALRIEAIQIRLVEKTANNNISIKYSSHVQNVGWTSYVENGKISGTEGKSLRLEGISIKLSGANTTTSNLIEYRVHVQDIGWMNWVQEAELAGTVGKGKRIEAIQIKVNSKLGKNIKYRVHVQDIGWTKWVSNGQTAGTEGQSKRIEAIEIKLE